MNEHRKEIMQNVYLTYLPARKFKTSCLSAQLVTQLDAATASYNALTPAVLHRGTVRCPDMEQLSAAMDRLYGAEISPSCRKRGERQCVGFVGTVIDDCFAPGGEQLLEPTAALLGELLLDPVTQRGRFVSEYVDSEKAHLIDAIRSIRNDKRDWADRRLIQEMCAQEPYGVSRWGEEENVKKINHQNLYQHYHTLLSQSRVELFYCGSAEQARVSDALLQAFAALPRGKAEIWQPMEKHPVRGEVRRITEHMDVTQGKLAMGLRCASEDAPAMMLVNLLFGGWSNSKLFLNVREKLSLCYYASSSYARSKGIMTVSSGIESRDYDRAVEEILHQLQAIQSGDWEDWELEGARTTMLSALSSLGDSQGSLENYYLGQAATDRNESPEELARMLQAVTPERIRAAAETVAVDTIYFLKGKEEAEA